METTAHFENIPQEIARRLGAATQEIVVAVAWFTDRDLFDVLCQQAGRGLRVRLAVLNERTLVYMMCRPYALRLTAANGRWPSGQVRAWSFLFHLCSNSEAEGKTPVFLHVSSTANSARETGA